MEQLPVTIKCIVDEDGHLKPNTKSDEIRRDMFKKALTPETIVEVTYQVYNPDYSIAQINKIHKMIRVLASDNGESFQDMKNMVKKQAGFLPDIETGEYRSFSKCTKEEISSAIQAAIKIGEFTGSNLTSY